MVSKNISNKQQNEWNWSFVHNEVGYNYRLTNLQVAFGCAQLEQLDDYIAVKKRIVENYTNVTGLLVTEELVILTVCEFTT